MRNEKPPERRLLLATLLINILIIFSNYITDENQSLVFFGRRRGINSEINYLVED
tara:strand:- start:974 stop:1138 length:165 start_codon:yes stop_codon:yes gene_type:complete